MIKVINTLSSKLGLKIFEKNLILGNCSDTYEECQTRKIHLKICFFYTEKL